MELHLSRLEFFNVKPAEAAYDFNFCNLHFKYSLLKHLQWWIWTWHGLTWSHLPFFCAARGFSDRRFISRRTGPQCHSTVRLRSKQRKRKNPRKKVKLWEWEFVNFQKYVLWNTLNTYEYIIIWQTFETYLRTYFTEHSTSFHCVLTPRSRWPKQLVLTSSLQAGATRSNPSRRTAEWWIKERIGSFKKRKDMKGLREIGFLNSRNYGNDLRIDSRNDLRNDP